MRQYLVLLLVLSVALPQAAAHPFTEETIPSIASNPPAGVTEVIAHYSEPVDVAFSKLEVFDGSGNRVDNGDTAYYEGETALIVTTTPLDDGVYTVSSKVLSKIDGHLVPDAFLFAVGDAVADPALLEKQEVEVIFFPEAGARFPGMLGQTIVLGALIASIAVWGTHNKRIIADKIQEIEQRHHSKFMSLTGAGLVLVLASDVLMIAVQTVRLGAPLLDTVQTYFGTVWLARLLITLVLIGMWFMMEKKGSAKRTQMLMLAATLALISTTSLIGHGAATGEPAALVLDYVHNMVAGIWIGGILYIVFVLIPTLAKLEDSKRERMSLASIPRFSRIFIITLGTAIITGPTLLWFLESDVGLIVGSIYGQLVILKIVIASVMVGLGFALQFRTQKRAESGIKSGHTSIYRTLKRALRIDAALGIVLLGVVALLVNGTLPAGQIQDAGAQASYGYHTTEFTQDAMFAVDISPFASGTNTIAVSVYDPGGAPLYDSENIKVKVSNPSKGISPIEVVMESGDGELFTGEVTFGFSGEWQVEVEAQRTENPNESKILDLLVKPRLSSSSIRVIEYDLPEDAKPLYPLYHDGHIWVSDPSAPRVWQFDPNTEQFTKYEFEGITTTFLTADPSGNVWFVDTPGNQIGMIDTATGEITTKTIPKLDPLISDNTPIAIQADLEGGIWVAVINKDRLVRYVPDADEFEEVRLPLNSLPFALDRDAEGNIWYTASGPGKIGYVDPGTLQITEIPGVDGLEGPEALLFDDDGALWIAEHTGSAIIRYDPVFGTIERVTVPDPDALPFGMALDRFGNVWFAQHTVDNIGVYDPDAGELVEVPIDYESSFVQFMATDGEGGVWFVEQNANRLGTVSVTEIPVAAEAHQASYSVRYSEVVGPLMSAGIIAAALFLQKSINDRRRIDGLL